MNNKKFFNNLKWSNKYKYLKALDINSILYIYRVFDSNVQKVLIFHECSSPRQVLYSLPAPYSDQNLRD